MEYVLLSTVTSAFIIIAYTLGLKNGQRVQKELPVEMPKIEPIKAIYKAVEEVKKEVEQAKEDDRISTVMANIDSYPHNQRKVK